jgi:hypothetical protein
MNKKYSSILCVLFCFSLKIMAQNKLIEKEFEERIDIWEKSIAESQKQFPMLSTPKIDNSYFKEIVNMGPQILPLLIKKIHANGNAGYLGPIVSTISKTHIQSYFDKQTKEYHFPDYPDFSYVPLAYRKDKKEYVNIWVYWWTNGRKKTVELFQKKYDALQEAKKLKTAKEIDENYKNIQDMGVVIIPEIISKIKLGEKDLIPIFAYLIDNQVSSTASSQECEKWWLDNKDKYKVITDLQDMN